MGFIPFIKKEHFATGLGRPLQGLFAKCRFLVPTLGGGVGKGGLWFIVQNPATIGIQGITDATPGVTADTAARQ